MLTVINSNEDTNIKLLLEWVELLMQKLRYDYFEAGGDIARNLGLLQHHLR